MSVIKISSANEERQASSIRYLESRGIAVHEGQYDGLEKVARIMRDQDAYMATITTMRDAIVSALRKFAATWKNASHGWVIVIVPDTQWFVVEEDKDEDYYRSEWRSLFSVLSELPGVKVERHQDFIRQ